MLPLDDVRIIAIEQYGAGPIGSLVLADLGATVIKIEDPATGGDIGRYVPPYTEGEDSLFFESINRNKQSISLDISSPAGREVFEDLVRHADAVYSNLRGDVPAKLGIRYDDLKHLNPKIVCCSLTGFGMTGPLASQPGYDYVLQGLAGWMTLTGEPGSPPAKTGLSVVDFSGGFIAAISLLAGIHTARRTNTGMDCDVSLYDTAISMLAYLATWHLTADYTPTRTSRSAHPSLVPFQVFPAKDGWLVIGCAKEKFWHRLVDTLGRPELAQDERFVTFADRLKHREELQDILDDVFQTRTVEHWVHTLRSASVPCGPINDVHQALTAEHTLARNLIISTAHDKLGDTRHVLTAARVGSPRQTHTRAPYRGEHTQEVLQSLLTYDIEKINKLREEGAFGAETAERLDGDPEGVIA